MCPEDQPPDRVASPEQDTGGSAAPADPVPADVAGGPVIYGLLDVAGTILAVNALHIREATPYPERISPMAASFPGLLGAMILRDDTIPLVSLRTLLGIGGDCGAEDEVVIVLSHEGRLVGLVVDALRGMTATQDSQTARMGLVGSGEPPTGARNFVHDGAVVGILEPETVFGIAGLPFSDRSLRVRNPDGSSRSGHSGQRAAYLLSSYQNHLIAFPVDDVQATIPMTPLADSPVVHGYCDGVITYHGHDIPVVDTLQVLGIGSNFSRPERSASVALRFGGNGYLAMEIDRFFDIVHCSLAEIRPLPAVISTRQDLFLGVYEAEDGRHYLVVDPEACRGDQDLANLASSTLPETAQDAEDQGGRRRSLSRDLYLVFRAAKRVASRLTDIVEIIRLPPQMHYCDVRHDGYMGTISHRSQLVPVFSIANMLGDFPFYEEEKASVLLFREGDQLFGMAIEQLEAVERCQPAPPPASDMVQSQKKGEFLPLFDLAGAMPGSGGGFW